MVLLLFALFGLAVTALLLWSRFSTQKLIRELRNEGAMALSPSVESRSDPAAMEEVLKLHSNPQVKGVGVAERAFCSFLIFQVGTPPSGATLDTTMIGLRPLELPLLRDGGSDMVQEVLHNARKSLPDFLRNLLDRDTGGGRFDARGYPTVYGSYYIMDGAKWLYDVGRESHLSYEKLAELISTPVVERFLGFIRTCEHDVDKNVKAFGETPRSKVGNITTGGAAAILRDLGMRDNYMDWDRVNFEKDTPQNLAAFISLCKVPLKLNGAPAYGFANDNGIKIPQTSTTRHALKAYNILCHMGFCDVLADLSVEAIAGFFETCRSNGGYSRIKGEESSVYYTDQVLCSWAYVPFNQHPEVMKRLVEYDKTLYFLESYVVDDGFGWAKGTPPNMYAARAAADILLKLTELYEDYPERDEDREKRLGAKVRNAILAHFDIRSGLAVGYRPIRGKG